MRIEVRCSGLLGGALLGALLLASAGCEKSFDTLATECFNEKQMASCKKLCDERRHKIACEKVKGK